ncbi:hypothetical protein HGH92_04305 [Chitinophaga varians]|uniref:Uncharacterized protein n=1 Tax=Chitinophaga varians TaxID=2202339 RepID=A0A847RKM1_9BACT|nr:hypothetical protein [Chitinophaga varians]NLR63522.1 hypothetical protein [Chitinophaga varians]
MEHIPENIKVVARFILLSLQRTLADIHMSEHLEERDHQKWYNESFLENVNTDISFSQAEQQHLNQGLTAMTYHLPVVLYNAGLTKTLIPASRIYCQLQNNLLGVYVQEVGTFILDIQYGRMVTFMWPTVASDKTTAAPATDSLSRYRLHTNADMDGRISRDAGFLKDKAKDAIQDKIKAFAKAPAGVNLMKFRSQIKHFGGVHDVYKGLFKERDLVKGVLAGNPGEIMADLSTKKAGEGNFPGIDYVPGATQLLDIMANDKFKDADLENINMAQKAPADQGGGYGPLTRMMDAYNRHWGTEFVGLYLMEDAYQQALHNKTIPGSLTRHYTSHFDLNPRDASGHLYKYFIYMHVEDVKGGDIDFQKIGVMKVNPKD